MGDEIMFWNKLNVYLVILIHFVVFPCTMSPSLVIRNCVYVRFQLIGIMAATMAVIQRICRV